MAQNREREILTLQQAAAIQYKDAQELPRVVAAGCGELARKIVELALENNIPVTEDPILAPLLAHVTPGAYINDESFRLVAEVISFLYHTDAEWRKAHEELVPE